jgi:hypothetical protein
MCADTSNLTISAPISTRCTSHRHPHGRDTVFYRLYGRGAAGSAAFLPAAGLAAHSGLLNFTQPPLKKSALALIRNQRQRSPVTFRSLRR